MRRMRCAVLLVLACAGSVAAQTTADRRAVEVVDQMMAAMGGVDGWERMRFLRFDWVVEREGKTVVAVQHLWDRYDGRYRVEWERDGKRYLALFNVNSRQGQAFVDGQPAEGEDKKKMLEQAYGRFINDTYWLLMPWKLRDPGVILDYAGEAEMDGETYDIVHVSFQQVGLTPGDHYWAFVNRRTRLMDRWAYFLESYRKDKGEPALEKATPWNWRDWRETGGLRLACDRQAVGQNARIHFPTVKVMATLDESAFHVPTSPMPGGVH